MVITTDLDWLTRRLKALSYGQRIEVALKAGLFLEMCAACGCYVGAPYCHNPHRTADKDERCPCPEAGWNEASPPDNLDT